MVAFALKIFWIIGFILSFIGLTLQVLIYVLIPCSRSLDQKLLTQLTVARLLNTIFEYLTTTVPLKNPVLNDVAFALYVQTDAAMICWMFVFTKNIYDDIVHVFVQKPSFLIVTVIIWCVTIPIGILSPVMMELDVKKMLKDPYAYPTYFEKYYDVYAGVKFAVLTMNLIMFACIFQEAIRRKDGIGSTLKTSVVSFILVSISSAQVFLNDLLTFFLAKNPSVSSLFAVINSYQIIVITAIFMMIMKNRSKNESLKKQIVRKLVRQPV